MKGMGPSCRAVIVGVAVALLVGCAGPHVSIAPVQFTLKARVGTQAPVTAPEHFLVWYKWPLLQQTVQVGDLSATVVVRQIINSVDVSIQWQSPDNSRYPLACLSGYRDVRYELRTSDGHVIPANQSTIEHPPEEHGGINHVDGRPAPPCTAYGGHKAETFAALRNLYPRLPAGTYTLQITVAPRSRPLNV